MCSTLRRQLVGQDVAFLPHVDPDRKLPDGERFSVVKFMDPTDVDPSFLVRRLLPVQIPGWSRGIGRDDRPGAPQGGIVRAPANLPMVTYGGAVRPGGG
jgi:hypothetical protein